MNRERRIFVAYGAKEQQLPEIRQVTPLDVYKRQGRNIRLCHEPDN